MAVAANFNQVSVYVQLPVAKRCGSRLVKGTEEVCQLRPQVRSPPSRICENI